MTLPCYNGHMTPEQRITAERDDPVPRVRAAAQRAVVILTAGAV